MQFVICGHIFPEWELDALFFAGEHQSAFLADTSFYTHPIFTPLEKEADAPYLFDEITYDKGATIIRMMSHLVDTYTSSGLLPILGEYIKENLYSGVDTEQLLSKIGSSIHSFNLNEVMYLFH